MIAGDCLEGGGSRQVADGAVVVILRRRMFEPQQCNHVLMPVMWKLDRKLQLCRRVAKRITHIDAWRGLRVTDRTNRRPRAAEELRPVTTHACIMTGVIRDIGKSYLVTRVAGCAMFLRGVRKFRVIDG